MTPSPAHYSYSTSALTVILSSKRSVMCKPFTVVTNPQTHIVNMRNCSDHLKIHNYLTFSRALILLAVAGVSGNCHGFLTTSTDLFLPTELCSNGFDRYPLQINALCIEMSILMSCFFFFFWPTSAWSNCTHKSLMITYYYVATELI